MLRLKKKGFRIPPNRLNLQRNKKLKNKLILPHLKDLKTKKDKSRKNNRAKVLNKKKTSEIYRSLLPRSGKKQRYYTRPNHL